MSCIPKCGTQTLRQIFKTNPIPNSQVLDCPERIVWLRNPKERLISAYSYFHTITDEERYSTWEKFIDHVLLKDDSHWTPQVQALSYKGEYLGTITHRFEDLPKLWGNYFKGLIPHINGCVHEEIAPYRESEIQFKYREDFNKWHGLLPLEAHLEDTLQTPV